MIDTYNAVLKFVYSAVKSGSSESDVAREAEKLAGTNRVEYHPLICDAVVSAFPDEDAPPDAKPRSCAHVSGDKRKAAKAALKAATPSEAVAVVAEE